jgi:hypothetical protein
LQQEEQRRIDSEHVNAQLKHSLDVCIYICVVDYWILTIVKNLLIKLNSQSPFDKSDIVSDLHSAVDGMKTSSTSYDKSSSLSLTSAILDPKNARTAEAHKEELAKLQAKNKKLKVLTFKGDLMA